MILLLFDISGGELLIIMIGVFLVFGPKRMPEIARTIGKGMNELKRATSDLTREFQQGANQVRRQVQEVTEDFRNEATKVTSDILSGPSSFAEDAEIVESNDSDVPTEESIQERSVPSSPSGSIPRE